MSDSEWTWPMVTKETKDGTLDEMIEIRAAPGAVEITMKMAGGGLMLKIPSEGINHLVDRLESARDAAALMSK
jgi:hypothetical protein